MAEDPAGRFHLVEAPALPPGVDGITRTSIGPFVDTGYDIKFAETGRLYLSIDTIRELATVAGLLDNLESMSSLQDEYNRGRDDELRENLLGNLRDIADELVAAADRLAGLGYVAPGEDVPDLAAAIVEDAGDERPADEAAGVELHEHTEPVDAGDDQAAAPAGATGRQGNGARGKRRLAGVSGGSGDGADDYRI